MSIEMTISEIAEVLGIICHNQQSCQRTPEEDTKKWQRCNQKLPKWLNYLEEIYKKTILKMNQSVMMSNNANWMEILVDEKNAEILRLYEQLKAKDQQLTEKMSRCASKTVRLQKGQTVGSTATVNSSS